MDPVSWSGAAAPLLPLHDPWRNPLSSSLPFLGGEGFARPQPLPLPTRNPENTDSVPRRACRGFRSFPRVQWDGSDGVDVHFDVRHHDICRRTSFHLARAIAIVADRIT